MCVYTTVCGDRHAAFLGFLRNLGTHHRKNVLLPRRSQQRLRHTRADGTNRRKDVILDCDLPTSVAILSKTSDVSESR
jgi:hypothetical protein